MTIRYARVLRIAGAIPVLFAMTGAAQAASLSGAWGVSDSAVAGGQVTLQFDSGKYTFVRDGQRIAHGQYTIRGDEIEFVETAGTQACASGKYQLNLGDRELSLTPLADACEQRLQAFGQPLVSMYPSDQPQHFEVKFGYTSSGEMKVRATSEVGAVDLPLNAEGTFAMPKMRRGDTVRYVSDDGIVTIRFDEGSPYGQQRVVTGGEVVTVAYSGEEERSFKSHCSVELTNVATLASFTKMQTAWGDGWGASIPYPR